MICSGKYFERFFLSAVLLFAVYLLNGCYVSSLQPLFTDENEMIFDPALVGTWTGRSGDNDWTISVQPSVDHRYAIDCEFKSGPMTNPLKYKGCLGAIGKVRLIDLESIPEQAQPGLHHVPVHIFMRIRLDKNKLELDLIKDDWVRAYLAEHKGQGTYSEAGMNSKDLLFTGDQQQTRKLVEQLADKKDAFITFLTLRRVSK